MNQLATVAKTASRMIMQNSPVILTSLGVGGVVTTSALAIRGTIKAVNKVNDANHRRASAQKEPLTKGEVVKLVWPDYIPAAGMGAVTISAILSSHHLSTRRQAAIMSLYSITNEAFSEYKTKVVEKIGEKQELAVRDELAKERMDNHPVTDKTVIIAGSGDVLCFDEYTGRYFEGDFEALRGAENSLNSEIINNGYASLNDWYRLIGIPAIPTGEEVGWNSDKLMSLRLTSNLAGNKPALSVGFHAEPLEKYYKAFR